MSCGRFCFILSLQPNVAASVSAFRISRTRVRGFQARYADKQLVFAVHPAFPEDADDSNSQPPEELMMLLEDLIPEMVKESGTFSIITGADLASSLL